MYVYRNCSHSYIQHTCCILNQIVAVPGTLRKHVNRSTLTRLIYLLCLRLSKRLVRYWKKMFFFKSRDSQKIISRNTYKFIFLLFVCLAIRINLLWTMLNNKIKTNNNKNYFWLKFFKHYATPISILNLMFTFMKLQHVTSEQLLLRSY